MSKRILLLCSGLFAVLLLSACQIDIEKATNGDDADSPPGPTIQAGDLVEWTYVVTNNGLAPLTNVQVTDDQGVEVSCPRSQLAVGESMTCTGTGIAVEGQYQNLGTATGTLPSGRVVIDSDPSHYLGFVEYGAIDIEKATNGDDADSPQGSTIPPGDPVEWTYVVTNTGNVPLTDVQVTDDQGVEVSCPKSQLAVDESMTCSGTGIAVEGQYQNLGTATGTLPSGGEVSHSDPSHYFGFEEYSAIDIEKATNGDDADSPQGPTILAGDPVQWTYVVTNTGNVPLSNIHVTDNQGVGVSCPRSQLAVDESMTCTGTGIAVEGQYQNLGTATGTSPSGGEVSDSDPSHYFGNIPEVTCVDSDGDGYVVCQNCTVPDGKQCGECDDSDSSIHPGVTDLCDGINNDCDDEVDEDFPVDQECAIESPSGCITGSILECLDGVETCPEPESGVEEPTPEVAYTPECHDGLDNDCDGYVDQLDVTRMIGLVPHPGCSPVTELCNGLDDDYDGETDEDFTYSGIPLGDPCTVGEGICQRTGTVICSADGLNAICTAVEGTSKTEDTPGTGRCIDGLDNDCDGYVDIADADCQEEERCDGVDNDGNDGVDEDFIAELGLPCTVGEGACQRTGVKVCSSDGTTTVCSVVPALASIEGPVGSTCNDDIDNDCDGLTDELDPGCASADLAVSCALPYLHGEPGRDCTGMHEISFDTNAGPNALVTAELLALDVDGNILEDMIPLPVENGDEAHLASRLDPDDWKCRSWTYTGGTRTRHEVFAPVPMLRVTVQDGLNKSQAYCSNIPYVQVVEPSGTVVSASEGDVTNVLAAIPLTDPSSLSVMVDCVDILAEMGISDPADCTLGAPCSGTVTINSQSVEVSELVVQGSPIDVLGINTLRMKLSNLGCGGHAIVVEGQQLPGSLFPSDVAEACHVDDLHGIGTSSGLSIDLTDPTECEELPLAPVNVTGKACSGREITGVQINNCVVDISGQYVDPDGVCEDSGDTYVVPINIEVGLTDLVQDVQYGDVLQCSFDKGPNFLSGRVIDDLGNTSYSEKWSFAAGPVASPLPCTPPLRVAGVQEQVFSDVEARVKEAVQAALNATETEIENAFVVGLTPDAVNTLFSEKCTDATGEFENRVRANIAAKFPFTRIADGGCSCDPPVKITLDSVTFPGDITCSVDFNPDTFHVTMNLPNVVISINAYGYCKTTFLGACVAKTVVDGWATTTISQIKMEFDVTENQLMGASGPAPTFNIGVEGQVDSHISSNVHCLASVCNWFVELFLTALTFGSNGWIDLTPEINISQDLNFQVEVGAGQPDPVSLGEIKVDKEEVEEYGQELEGNLSSVEITANGIVAGLKGKFSTTAPLDPEVQSTPGAVLTPAGLPLMAVPDAGGVFIALADDTLNQLFASLTVSGKLKTGCQDSGKTVGDLLPVDCDTLSVGECSLDSSISCKEAADCAAGSCVENSAKTAILQGACHGFKGDDCEALPLGRKLVCRATKDKLEQINISSGDSLLFCVRQDVPPRLLIQDNASTYYDVETVLRLNDLSVAMILDRDGDGLDGQLSSTPKCLAEGAPTEGDCYLFALCLDLNIETAMQLATKHCENDPEIICTDDSGCTDVGGPCVDVCEGGKPGFVTRVNEIVITPRAAGVMCGGTTTPGDDDLIATEAATNSTNDILLENATRYSPPICAEGLTLGGFVQFANPRLIAIEADGDPDFQEYLGITGDVAAP